MLFVDRLLVDRPPLLAFLPRAASLFNTRPWRVAPPDGPFFIARLFFAALAAPPPRASPRALGNSYLSLFRAYTPLSFVALLLIPPLQVKVRLTGNPLNSDPTVVLCHTLTRSALDRLAASSRRWKQWLGELERDMRPHSYGSAALSRKQLARNQKNLQMETASGPFKTETGLMGAFEFLPMRSKPLLSCVSRAFRVVAMKTEFADWFDTWDRPIKDGENNGGTTRGGSLEIDPVARGSDHDSGSAGPGSAEEEPEDQPGLAAVILRFTITDLPPCRNEVYRFQFIRGMITVDLTDADAAPDTGAPHRPSRRATVPNLPSWRQLPGVMVGGAASSTNPFPSRPVNRETWPPKKKPHRIRRFWNTLMHVVFRRKKRVVPVGSPPKLFPNKKS